MSTEYHKELFNNGRIKLMANYANIKDDIASKDLSLHFFAVDSMGTPIFTEVLGLSEIRNLYNHLNCISLVRDSKVTSSKFIEVTDDINHIIQQLEVNDLAILLPLLEKFKSEEKIRGLLESLSDLEIENLHGAYHHKRIQTEIQNLELLLQLERTSKITDTIQTEPKLINYIAGQSEKIFQNWIENNLWIFGVDYVKKHNVRKIAMFSEGDLLMESVDGYLDLIELKRPNQNILKYDPSHKCYYPHKDLSGVIGQSLFYLQKLEEYKLIIEKEYEVKVIMPRIKIIVGRSDEFNNAENDCIRMLNSKLNSVKIITYDDLVSYGKLLLDSQVIGLL